MRKARRFRGMFIGAGIIPIGPRLARQFVPTGADLTRLNSGTHPVLLNHHRDYRYQYGRVVSAEAVAAGVQGEIEIFGYEDLVLTDGVWTGGTSPEVAAERERVHQMLDDGCRNLSIGTRLYESEWIETDMGDVIRSTMWEPDELSLVAVGASRPARLLEEVT